MNIFKEAEEWAPCGYGCKPDCKFGAGFRHCLAVVKASWAKAVEEAEWAPPVFVDGSPGRSAERGAVASILAVRDSAESLSGQLFEKEPDDARGRALLAIADALTDLALAEVDRARRREHDKENDA